MFRPPATRAPSIQALSARAALALALVATVALLGGCKKKSDRVKVQNDQPDQFVWVAELYSEDTDQSIDWNSSLSGVVRVEFKADGYTGNARVRVFDGNGDQVFDEDFGGLDSNYRESHFSAPATAGAWRVLIELDDASGDLRVIIDQNV